VTTSRPWLGISPPLWLKESDAPQYATAGHDPTDVADHRARAPWYATKAQPSTADMAAKLRRVIIAARFKASRPDQPTPEEISVLRLAWEDTAA